MNLSAEQVSVLRGRTEIVHDVSFSVSDGQWLMICGPNGAGKSTLLSAVSQELPYTGLVTLDGTDLRRMKPRPLARRMAMLRQLQRPRLRLHGGRGRRDGAIRASGAFAGGQRRRGSGGARAPSRAIAGQAASKHPDALRRRTPADAACAGAVSGAGRTAAGRTRQPFGFALPAGTVSAHRRVAARTGARGGIRRA